MPANCKAVTLAGISVPCSLVCLPEQGCILADPTFLQAVGNKTLDDELTAADVLPPSSGMTVAAVVSLDFQRYAMLTVTYVLS